MKALSLLICVVLITTTVHCTNLESKTDSSTNLDMANEADSGKSAGSKPELTRSEYVKAIQAWAKCKDDMGAGGMRDACAARVKKDLADGKDIADGKKCWKEYQHKIAKCKKPKKPAASQMSPGHWNKCRRRVEAEPMKKCLAARRTNGSKTKTSAAKTQVKKAFSDCVKAVKLFVERPTSKGGCGKPVRATTKPTTKPTKPTPKSGETKKTGGKGGKPPSDQKKEPNFLDNLLRKITKKIKGGKGKKGKNGKKPAAKPDAGKGSKKPVTKEPATKKPAAKKFTSYAEAKKASIACTRQKKWGKLYRKNFNEKCKKKSYKCRRSVSEELKATRKAECSQLIDYNEKVLQDRLKRQAKRRKRTGGSSSRWRTLKNKWRNKWRSKFRKPSRPVGK